MCFRDESPELLREAIESILAQTYQNFELILVDDASVLKYDFLKNLLSQHSQIKYYKNETNMGLTKSLNKGYSVSKGEYIARLDSDDISLPQRLEVQVQFLENNREFVLVGSRFIVCSEGREYEPPESREIQDKEIRKIISSQNFTAHSTIVMRGSAFKKIKGYNEFYYYAQDYDLYLRMLGVGQIKVLNEVLVKRNMLKAGISFKKRREQRFYALIIMLRGFLKYGGGGRFFTNLFKAFFVVLMPSRITEFIKKLSYFSF